MLPHLHPLESRRLFSHTPAVPSLSSRPTAPNTLYLDFNGDSTPSWAGNHPGATPAFDTDGNPSSFSAAELAAIHDTFARVADAFSPFNLNVTTVPPKRAAGHRRRFVTVVIGGTGDWLPTSHAGGIAQVGSFFKTNLQPKAFVFTSHLYPTALPIAVAHEAGHTFGLAHQARRDSHGQLLDKYNPGTPDAAPIMGIAYFAAHPRWWRGPSARTLKTQDDIAILTRVLGRAPDDAPDSPANAKRLKPNATGVIRSTATISTSSDTDWFSFTLTAARNVRARITAPGMLAPGAALLDTTGKVLLRLTPQYTDPPLRLHAGTYRLRVRTDRGYGNVGRYTVTVAPVPPTPSSFSAAPAVSSPSNAIDLTWHYARRRPDSFTLLRSSDGGAHFTRIAQLPGDQTTFTDAGLPADVPFAYRVIATVAGADSAPTTTATRTAPGIKFVAAAIPYNYYSGYSPGDFNGDGKADLVDLDGRVFLGNGDGSFSGPSAGSPTLAHGPDLFQSAAVIDFDHDGLTDLAVFTPPASRPSRSPTFTVYFGNRDGTLRQGPTSTLSSPVVSSLQLADLTGDGIADMLDFQHSLIIVGRRDGSLGNIIHLQLATDALIFALPRGDFNGDGLTDFVSYDRSFTTTIQINNGDGTVRPSTSYVPQTTSGAVIPVVADFNGDGRSDAAFLPSTDSTTIQIFLARPDGTLANGPALTTRAAGNLLAADVNADGLADLIRLSTDNGPANVLLARPDGTFSPAHATPGDLAAIGNAHSVSPADFDGDGRDDLLVPRINFQSPQILFNRTMLITPT